MASVDIGRVDAQQHRQQRPVARAISDTSDFGQKRSSAPMSRRHFDAGSAVSPCCTIGATRGPALSTSRETTMLFEPARHEPLLDVEWDATRARAAIVAIVEEIEAMAGTGIIWPSAPAR